MKQIINGKMYNTETAEEIGAWSNGLGRNDFRNRDEILYRKKTGEFFLYGRGGALTNWADSCNGNMTCEGCGIEPLSIESAKQWIEKFLDADKYVKYFGEVEE